MFAQIDIDMWVTVLKQYGPVVVLVGFVLWQGWSRERRLTTRLMRLEADYRQVLVPLVEKCAAVIAENTSVMQRLEQAMVARFVDLPTPLK
jgi:hypothetical protein